MVARAQGAIGSGTTTVTLTEAWAAPSQARVDATIQRVAEAGYSHVLDYAMGRVSAACSADVEALGLAALWRPACLSSMASERARVQQAPFTCAVCTAYIPPDAYRWIWKCCGIVRCQACGAWR